MNAVLLANLLDRLVCICRDKIAVSTKVTGPSGKMTWIRDGPERLDGRNIRQALGGSLQRLQTDYIDLYYLHWPDRFGLHLKDHYNSQV